MKGRKSKGLRPFLLPEITGLKSLHFTPKLPKIAPVCPHQCPRRQWHTLVMNEHLEYIRGLYDHTRLSPKEIARVLYGEGKDTKKRIEMVRQELDEGTLIPGLEKTPGKHWRVDAVQLAKAMEARARGQGPAIHDQPAVSQPPLGRKSRFKNPGQRLPRFLAKNSHAVWLEIHEEMLLLASADLRDALSGEVVDRPDRDPDPGIIF